MNPTVHRTTSGRHFPDTVFLQIAAAHGDHICCRYLCGSVALIAEAAELRIRRTVTDRTGRRAFAM